MTACGIVERAHDDAGKATAYRLEAKELGIGRFGAVIVAKEEIDCEMVRLSKAKSQAVYANGQEVR